MSKYCKAYSIERLQAYPHWREKSKQSTQPRETPGHLSDGETLGADGLSYCFLHTDFVVTRDVFADEDVIFDDVTEEWKKYCVEVLEFNVPEDIGSAEDKISA